MEPTRSFKPFQVVSEYQPSGDQPRAIAQLADRLEQGESDVVLLGATGTGKSATTAWLIEKLQRPTLVLAHNKTLAAQLANEFRQLLPHNAVEYFVSYYDYYQPEAYVPQTDTFIEKDTSINAEVERLGHSTTNALLSRRDVVVVASVSCIYGLGKPEEYYEAMLPLAVGDTIERDFLIRRLIEMQYQRNDIDFSRGNFRVRGDTIEIIPMYEELAIRIEMFGDEIERLSFLHPLTGDVLRLVDTISIFPGSHYVARRDVVQRAMEQISAELEVRSKELKKQQKLVEEQRLRMRTTFDLEMMEEIGFCSGMENYSMHMDGRSHGEPPNCLLDYFPDDFLTVIDESHVTVPQLGAMYEGDAARKRTLVEHGFRLPSALDNRPLKFAEFTERIGQVVYLSATPGKYELERADGVVEQIIRPTGLVDPEIIVKPSTGQIDDLLEQVRLRTAQDERVLVTTLTKKMAEQLTDFMEEAGIRVRYLHSDVDTLKRVELLSELRAGVFDVLIGINLLREGLDLPEVSLVAILDADKEGFLRSTTSLIQTIGRAARNVNGQVHMYADRVTKSMQTAIEETNRRREIQLAHNKKHGINPTPLRKKLGDITEVLAREAADTEEIVARRTRGSEQSRSGARTDLSELERIIKNLTEQMLAAAEELKFELAGRLRDELQDLKRELKRIRAAQK
ncbi:excinuclease ABC subunit UvrB [Canibacter sp. lx-45]|uniref:excinuclease ABC subunit UvrB n=1 Tax=Canibacter zhuwentaonis TaxID=2837491 RepID=UPI001BDC720E|nr:excinuclease ABC subunit UvrB [Canibacter zhuwentaonis]MBT1035670.1 excinuclease ABC subunit UvrB [Canibacter zhuwentaonis]